MILVRAIEDFRRALRDLPRPIGLVPTMGALHAGHASLVEASAKECATTAVTLFVNPTQFAPTEDLARYPRREAADVELVERCGGTVVFAPSDEEMYPRKTTEVRVFEVSELFEGQARPTHFQGVATVVLKLFNIAQADVAYFGWKDLQQCAVIRRMVEDLNVPIRLRFCDTVREPDGLAMSSRNGYLSPEDRAVAPLLYQALSRLREVAPSKLDAALKMERQSLERAGFQVDYLEVVDVETLRPSRTALALAAVVAAKIGNTRLIDNVRF